MTKQRRSVRPVRPDRANPEPRPPKPLQVHETGILVLPPSMIKSFVATEASPISPPPQSARLPRISADFL